MTYQELRQWFIEWLDKQQNPVPLYWDGAVSPDVRKSIQIHIYAIDNTENPKKSDPARASKNNLLRIKEAILNESHDISIFGYTIEEKYKRK